MTVDVFVCGGGPAGLAAAIAIRQAGFEVVVADARHPPIDKACGEGLMPDSVESLSRLGIALPGNAGFAFKGISFSGTRHQANAKFRSGFGMGVRRTTLHMLLVDRAVALGIELRWESPVCSLDRLGARWIIGADGAQSSVRRWAGLNSFVYNTNRWSFRQHFRIAPWSEYVEIYWRPGFQLYVTPVAINEVGVALISRDPHFRVMDAVGRVPELRARLCGSMVVSSERGAPASNRGLTRVAEGNTALVGDASGSVDPITGEGLGLAFKQAFAVADAIRKDDFHGYEVAHRRLSRRTRTMSRLLLMMDRSLVLQQRVLATFERCPGLFSGLLNAHVSA